MMEGEVRNKRMSSACNDILLCWFPAVTPLILALVLIASVRGSNSSGDKGTALSGVPLQLKLKGFNINCTDHCIVAFI